MASGKTTSASRQFGFSLPEILIGMTIVLIMVSVAVAVFPSMYAGLRADSAWESLMAELRSTRQESVSQRRTFQVTFTGTDQIQVARQELSGAFTDQPLWALPNGLIFALFPGQPDTPDAFGRSQAIDFSNGAGGLAGNTIYFWSDGSVRDSAGNFVNGTVFIGHSGQPSTARAITVMGATGIFHGYRYDKSSNTFQ